MQHAGPDALDRPEGLLSALRELPALREKSQGSFYRGSRAFLHFHEDLAGLLAYVPFEAEFQRMDVSNAQEQDADGTISQYTIDSNGALTLKASTAVLPRGADPAGAGQRQRADVA